MLLSSSSTCTATLRQPTQGQTVLLRGVSAKPFALPPALAITAEHAKRSVSPNVPLFTWAQLQDIVASGNLQKLSRHPDDLREYFAWMENIRHEYGAVHSYILAKKITASKLVKAHSEPADSTLRAVRHFQASFVPGVDCQILVNDWPYSVPHDATHHVVWSYLPILHPDLVTPDLFQQDIRSQAWSIISRRGLCGTLSSNGALQLPGILDHLVHLPSIALDSISQTNVEDAIRSACSHLVLFIQQHWDLKTHEAVFFANPPSLQSVPSLAHFHVIVKPLSS